MSTETENKKNLIGVFDSGLGGLTVFKSFLEKLPDYNYLYLGDNARLPYGSKSQETIYRYTEEAVDFLFEQGCRLIIIACNTASSRALRRLQNDYLPKKYPDRRLLGVIRPLAETVSANYRRIGIIGTEATIASGAYVAEIKKLSPEAEIFQQAAPLLVPLIESGWSGSTEITNILHAYLDPLKAEKIEALVLGCTHYPFLYEEISAIMGPRVDVLLPGDIIATKLEDYLSRHPELGLHPVAAPSRRYYVTDDPERFRQLAEKFLGQKIEALTKVVIDRS